MRLTKYPEVKTIREVKTILLTKRDGEDIDLEIQDIPPTYADEMQTVLPTPQPKVKGPMRDAKGRIERDERTGKPILLYEDDDPAYLRAKAQIETLQLVYLVTEGVTAGQLEFDAQLNPSNPRAFYEAALAEMKAFGFGLGQVTHIAQAVRQLAGITDEDMEKANAGFSPGAD